ncbi:MAG: 4Fe-4S binding protein [Deltaproteobacteria bacterium]|nr:4Fe-4S binding protein [Deltaproteobacteria bacterium]
MSEEVYRKLAGVLDTLPNGFPATETGIELKILKKVFTPEEAELFCDLRLSFETPQQIAQRTGRPLEGLEEMLTAMWRERGQILGIDGGSLKLFKMVPWAVGIYEYQVDRMDAELARLCNEYNRIFSHQFFAVKPQQTRVIPVETTVPDKTETLPYEQVSTLIEKGQSFAVGECVCRKEQRLLGRGCDRPLEVCMAIAPVPGLFDNYHWGRPITKKEAYELIRYCEEIGLVHQTLNVEKGHFFICNCCGCCCGILRSINELGIRDAINSNYIARIDPALCSGCGICADERCQVSAIEERGDVWHVIEERCIGCGLCVTTCPMEAVTLVRKTPEEQDTPPQNEQEWFRERGRQRGVDFSRFA